MSARTKVTPDMGRYYTPAEVELHNAPYDLWMSWLGHVYDLTTLMEERKGAYVFNQHSNWTGTSPTCICRRPTSGTDFQKRGQRYLTLVSSSHWRREHLSFGC